MAQLGEAEICFAPVLSMQEAIEHPHNRARGTFVEVDGRAHPAPAPRFDRTPAATPVSAVAPGEGGDEVLEQWGLDADEIASLRQAGAIA